MFLVGMQMAETGAAMARMSRALALSPGQQGVLVSLRFIGGVVIGLLLWAGHARVRVKAALAAALAVAASSGALLAVPSFAAAAVVAALRGLSVGAIIPLSGMFAAAQGRWPAGVVTSVVNASVSGGLVAVSAVAMLLSGVPGLTWQSYWLPASLVSVLLLVLLPRVEFPASGPKAAGSGAAGGTGAGGADAGDTQAAGPRVDEVRAQTAGAADPGGGRGSGQARAAGSGSDSHSDPPRIGEGVAGQPGRRSPARRTSWGLAVAGLLIVGSEGTLFGLLPAISAARGTVGLSGELYALLLMGGVLLGRTGGTFLFRVLSTPRVLAASTVFLAAVGLCWAFAPPLLPLWVGLIGIATASLFPGLVAFVSDERPESASATIAAIGWTGGLGGTGDF
jgi:MFS family permease